MNILVVHEVSYRNKVIYEYQDFAERLAARGHNVFVIDFDEHGPGGGPELISRTGLGHVTWQSIPCVNLTILKHLTARAAYVPLLEKVLQRNNIDAVFLYSVFINGTNTVRVCRKRGVPVIYRVLDAYHKLRENPLIKWPLLIGEKFIYRNADVVCLTNERMQSYVEGLIAPDRSKVFEVIHHGVDTNFFTPLPKDPELAARYQIRPDDKVALFLGTTYSFSGIDAVFKSFAKVKASYPRVKFIIVGGGDLDADLQRLVAELDLTKHVILTGMQPYDLVPRLLSLADLTFTSFYINDITRSIVPIKMLQYIACGKPVVCAPIPDVQRLLPEGESGITYRPIEAPQEFTQRMLDLLGDDKALAELGANALRCARGQWAMDKQIDRLEGLFSRAVNETHSSSNMEH